MNWKNQRIIVTGGTSGIGKELVRHFSSLGAKVSFCGLEIDRVQQVSEATGTHGQVRDLTQENDLLSFFKSSLKLLGGLDILINNAGYVIGENFTDLKRSDFEHMFAINSIAPAQLAQQAIPVFIQQGYGDIVNIGATGGSYAFPKGTAYSASKAALNSISKNLQLAHRKDNIRTFHVDPSWVTDTHNFNYGTPIPRDEKKLVPEDISNTIIHFLELDRRAFIPSVSIWGTQP